MFVFVHFVSIQISYISARSTRKLIAFYHTNSEFKNTCMKSLSILKRTIENESTFIDVNLNRLNFVEIEFVIERIAFVSREITLNIVNRQNNEKAACLYE